MANVYSRVTVVGARRRVDVVLPADESLGAMTGDLIRMLDEPTASPPLHRYLVTPAGEVLDGDSTLAAAQIEDGTILRLVGEERLPPAPVVYDVAEETASDRDSRRWSFDTTHRYVLGGATLAAFMLTLAVIAGSTHTLALLPVALAVLLAVLGIVVGRIRRPALSSAFLLSGLVVALYYVGSTDATADWPYWRRWALAALLVVATPPLFVIAGRRPRGAILGSAVGLLVLVLWAGGFFLAIPPVRVAGVLAVVCVAMLGFLPRLALLVSGVSALDDRRVGGQDVARTDVHAALASAHEGLVLACLAIGVAAGIAGVVLSTELTRWSIPLGCLLVFVLASRARSFPLVFEVVALVGAAVPVAIAYVGAWAASGASLGPVVALAGLGLLAVLAISVSLSEHAHARLRIVLDRVEMLAVVAMIPVVVGMFGTYGRLLDSF